MKTAVIVFIIVVAVAFIALLVWKNLKDEEDIAPDLTDELENDEDEERFIK